MIEKVATSYGVSAMQGVLSHQNKKHVIDGNRVIANRTTIDHKVDEVRRAAAHIPTPFPCERRGRLPCGPAVEIRAWDKLRHAALMRAHATMPPSPRPSGARRSRSRSTTSSRSTWS